MLPLQVIDSFLLQYNVGQVLLLGLIVTTLMALPLKSQKVIAINTILFGTIFMLLPFSLSPLPFLFLGLALVIIGPVLYVTAGD